jgi:hypothetical protein
MVIVRAGRGISFRRMTLALKRRGVRKEGVAGRAVGIFKCNDEGGAVAWRQTQLGKSGNSISYISNEQRHLVSLKSASE